MTVYHPPRQSTTAKVCTSAGAWSCKRAGFGTDSKAAKVVCKVRPGAACLPGENGPVSTALGGRASA